MERLVRLANPDKDIQPWIDARNRGIEMLRDTTKEDK